MINITRKPPDQAALVVTYLQFPIQVCFPCNVSPSPTLLSSRALVVLIIVYINPKTMQQHSHLAVYLQRCVNEAPLLIASRLSICLSVTGLPLAFERKLIERPKLTRNISVLAYI